MNECCECRTSEHEDLKNDAVLCFVRDPSTMKVVLRGKLCSEHVEFYAMDGYEVFEICRGGRTNRLA